MSHGTEVGLGALAPYPFLLLGVSWMGCLPEAQELEPAGAFLNCGYYQPLWGLGTSWTPA